MDPNDRKISSIAAPPSSSLAKSEHADDSEQQEEDLQEAFLEERVRVKIRVLAMMVGVRGCSEPGVVLAEVVRVLKELDGRARGLSRYNQKALREVRDGEGR